MNIASSSSSAIELALARTSSLGVTLSDVGAAGWRARGRGRGLGLIEPAVMVSWSGSETKSRLGARDRGPRASMP